MTAVWQRRRRTIIALVAVLLVVGAFLLWGPIGLGNGPLNLGSYCCLGQTALRGEQRAALVIPVLNSARATAVVDSVQFKGGNGFPNAHVLSLWTISYANCGGDWPVPARPGPPEMPGSCGAHILGPLIGHGYGLETELGGAMALAVVSLPSSNGCWVISAVVVHYHIGIRHYAATDPFGFTFCGARTSSALQQLATQASGG
jgi:hypothetical protein